MKAFILAAGFGSRLKPITDHTPKCLVPIKGKPLLQWWLELLEEYQIEEVLINTHYLAEEVHSFLQEYRGQVRVTEVYEPELLGSAGTIRNNIDFVKDEENFMVIYADNLTNINLEKMIQFHKQKEALFTIGTFYTNKPKECGILETDADGKVISFEEKPQYPKSNHANAGIYIVNQSMLTYFENPHLKDIGKDILPQLAHKMYDYPITEYIKDIGTMDNYEKANIEFERTLGR